MLISASKPLQQRKKRFALRTRTGCRTCRERRIKCDETKPVCRRCTSTGIECIGLGYGTHAEIAVAQDPHKFLLSLTCSPSYVPRINGSSEVMDLIYLVPRISQISLRPQVDDPSASLPGFVGTQDSRLSFYVDHLPARLGHSDTMDSAVDAVANAMRDLFKPSANRTSSRTFYLYAKALKHLQLSLQSSKDCFTPETLCATQLLGIFESLTRENGKVSNSHAAGTMRLLQLRGAERFSTSFERALLIGEANIIFFSALHSREPCFLNERLWRAVLRSTEMAKPSFFSLSELGIRKFEWLLPLPELVRACSKLITSGDFEGRDKLHCKVIDEVNSVRTYLAQWSLRWYDFLRKTSIEGPFGEFGSDDSWENRQACLISQQTMTIAYIRLRIALDGRGSMPLEDEVNRLFQDVSTNPILLTHGVLHHKTWSTTAISTAASRTSHEWRTWIKSLEGIPHAVPVLVPPRLWWRFTEVRPLFAVMSKNKGSS